MPFNSYLIQKFDFSHENFYFKELSEELSKRYSNSANLYVLIGNVSVNSHLIDAIFIRDGQISVIDFKDYGGKLEFSENNPWKIYDEEERMTFVSGGARMRNPFQQVRAYRFSLFQYLSEKEDEILNNNRNDVKWDRTSSIVLFQRKVDYNSEEIPPKIKRYFSIADNNTIFDTLELRNSGDLNFSDNEIQNILKVLDVRAENLFDPAKIYSKKEAVDNVGAEKLALIKKLSSKPSNLSLLKKILHYYRILINTERYKEPEAEDNYYYPIDWKNVKNKLNIKFEDNQEFNQVFLENFQRKFPKNLFVGINFLINNEKYPLLNTIIQSSDIEERDKIEININEFEIYNKSLEKLGLTEDIIEELKTDLSKAKKIDEKINKINENLGVNAILTADITLSLSTESLYTAQLQSELKRLIEYVDDNEFSSGIVEEFINNKPINQNNYSSKLNPPLSITELNNSQKEALSKVFKQPLTVVTGPPGTGKSQLVMNIIANAIVNDEKLLFASKNNKAVDTVKDKLDNEILKENFLLRFGSKKQVIDKAKPEIKRFLTEISQNHYQNKNKDLLDSKEQLQELNDKIYEYEGYLNEIPELEKSLKKLQTEYDHKHQDLKEWINQQEEDLYAFFIRNNLSLNIDLTFLNLLIKKVNSASKNLITGLFFNVFQKSKFLNKIIALNNSFPNEIKEYINKNNPPVDKSKTYLISFYENLELIEKLHNTEKKLKEEYTKFKEELENISVNINENTERLHDLKEQEEDFKNEINALNNKYISESRNYLNLYINQKMSSVDRLSVQRFEEFIPANLLYRKEDLKEFEVIGKNFLNNFNAISLTNLSVKNSFPLSNGLFDLLIIDEASQCDIASAIPLIFRAKKVVIIGDPFQLKHITSVKKYEENYLADYLDLKNKHLNYVNYSLYDHANNLANKSNLHTILLKEHYRCHPQIIEYSNYYFYLPGLGQTLNVNTKNDQFQYEPKGISWYHVEGQVHNKKNINISEVNQVIKLAKKYYQKYNDASIGIITPFRHQYEQIFNGLDQDLKENIKVGTIHTYQGDEKDIIILSLVISKDARSSLPRFIDEVAPYLLNVAVTRARSSLLIVGDFYYCNQIINNSGNRTYLSKLTQYVNSLNRVVLN